MKQTTTLALMLSLSVASLCAQQQDSVHLRFSGDSSASVIDLKHPGTSTAEENLAGNGTLGQFTFRLVKAGATAPQQSSTCSGSTKIYLPSVAGAGILRFQDGSLLIVTLTGGGDCIDFAVNEAQCTMTFQISGGTGRFQGATGVLNLSETAKPILGDASNNPVYFTEAGELTGTISRAGNSAP